MHGAFDPYRKWLGIRSADRPLNHHQLLGLELFEDDDETISHAADQRIQYVRALAVSDYAELSQRVLNELAAAKVLGWKTRPFGDRSTPPAFPDADLQ
jgi:hypothetical protein